MKNTLLIFAAALAIAGIAFASAPQDIVNVFQYIRAFLCTIIPALMLVCFLLAAVMYAAGQMASSEQRARFHGWATSLVIGGITCGVIYVLAPWIVVTVFGMPWSWRGAAFAACD